MVHEVDKSYIDQIFSYPLLSRDDEEKLGMSAVMGDESAIERLVESNLRLVVKIAHDYCGRGVSIDDLVQEGSIGLMIAARKFDPRKGAKFSTYCSFWIRQKMQRIVMRLSGVASITPKAFRDAVSAASSGMDDMEWRQRQRLLSALGTKLPFVDVITGYDEENSPYPSAEEGFMNHEDYVVARRLMHEVLDDKEERVMMRRFPESGRPDTLEEIAVDMNLTRERIRQIEVESIGKLRDALTS